LRQRVFAAYGEIMKLIPALLLFVCLTIPAFAQEPLRIGLSLPMSGPYKSLGEQARAGAEAAVKAMSANTAIELTLVDDMCTAEGGKAAAIEFLKAKVAAVAGFLCTAPLIETANVFAGAVPMVTLGVRTDAVTKKAIAASASLFRLSPTSLQELEAVSQLLVPLWRGKKFAILDDGTLRARELSESLRLAAEAQGLKPVLAETFKPGLEDQLVLLNRLKKVGVTHVFVGGDREDIAILAQDAASKDYKLTIAGSEALNAAPLYHKLPDGVLMIGLPPADASQITTDTKTVVEGYFLPAYAAVEIIASASNGVTANRTLSQSVSGSGHRTVLGDVKFAANGDQMDNPYTLMISNGGNFEVYQ
jgi:branched-chain amino acid transport system substrate-binding protein